jgi:hypothetical protein
VGSITNGVRKESHVTFFHFFSNLKSFSIQRGLHSNIQNGSSKHNCLADDGISEESEIVDISLPSNRTAPSNASMGHGSTSIL